MGAEMRRPLIQAEGQRGAIGQVAVPGVANSPSAASFLNSGNAQEKNRQGGSEGRSPRTRECWADRKRG